MHNMKKFILSLFVLSLVGTAAHAQKVGTLLPACAGSVR